MSSKRPTAMRSVRQKQTKVEDKRWRIRVFFLKKVSFELRVKQWKVMEGDSSVQHVRPAC